MIRIRHWACGLFPALLIACGDQANTIPQALVRDSAGVRIVENDVGVWQERDAWTVAPTPRTDIGGVEGDPTQQLFGVGDALRLPDGRIVVANYGSQELLFYAPDGAHLLTAGGRGGGPGEFQTMGGIEIWRDSMVVTNRRPPTLAFYDLGGRFVRSTRYQATPAGVFADGTVLATQTNFFEEPKDGMIRPPSFLLGTATKVNPSIRSVRCPAPNHTCASAIRAFPYSDCRLLARAGPSSAGIDFTWRPTTRTRSTFSQRTVRSRHRSANR